MRILWLSFGLLAVALAGIGIFLPLLPTVPFLLLAALCFDRSSDTLHKWLINHARFGAPIQSWQRSGAISKPAKQMASVSVLITFGISLLLGMRWQILLIQAIALSGVLIFIWTRPAE